MSESRDWFWFTYIAKEGGATFFNQLQNVVIKNHIKSSRLFRIVKELIDKNIFLIQLAGTMRPARFACICHTIYNIFRSDGQN